MSQGSAAGMRHLTEAHFSVQQQARLEELHLLLHQDTDLETEEDIETANLQEHLCRKSGCVPIRVFEFQRRNTDQFRIKARMDELLEAALTEQREHSPTEVRR